MIQALLAAILFCTANGLDIGMVPYDSGFARRVENALAEHDVAVTFVEGADPSLDAVIRLDDGGTRLRPRVAVLRSLSPTLYSWPEHLPPGIALPDSPDEAAEMASTLLLYAAGRCDAAGAGFGRLADAAFYRGNCALLAGDYKAAIAFYGDVLVDKDERPRRDTMTNLAWAAVQSGDGETALATMDQLVAYDWPFPRQSAEALADRAQIEALLFDYDAAIADMDAALRVYGETPAHSFSRSFLAELYTLRGQMVLLTYEWDAVLADYHRAIEADPAYAPAYFQRGVLYYTEGPREQALPDFERYLELAPEGFYADEAADYIESIAVELEALGTPQPGP